jgi:hypothetical protein
MKGRTVGSEGRRRRGRAELRTKGRRTGTNAGKGE